MKKKAIAAAMLGAVVTAGTVFGAVSADAASTAKTTYGTRANVNESTTRSGKTEFTGTIAATILSATIPTKVAFDVDPTKDPATGVQNQITEPDIFIENNSTVPIFLKVSDVASDSAASGVALVSTESGNTVTQADGTTVRLSGKKTMFTVKQTKPSGYGTAGEWLTVGNGLNFNVLPNQKAINTDKQIQVYVCGQTGNGWKVGETFKVTPTFVISAAPAADVAADGLLGDAIDADRIP